MSHRNQIEKDSDGKDPIETTSPTADNNSDVAAAETRRLMNEFGVLPAATEQPTHDADLAKAAQPRQSLTAEDIRINNELAATETATPADVAHLPS